MSSEKNRHEALRWLTTAVDDLETAEILIKNEKFAHSCFHAQQAAEKAIKAVWYFSDADPWGHSIRKLIEDLNDVDVSLYNELKGLVRIGMVLDRFYIPTRYPNGLPDITPDKAFDKDDAQDCINDSDRIIESVKSILKI